MSKGRVMSEKGYPEWFSNIMRGKWYDCWYCGEHFLEGPDGLDLDIGYADIWEHYQTNHPVESAMLVLAN
jgi:hypothetical protein